MVRPTGRSEDEPWRRVVVAPLRAPDAVRLALEAMIERGDLPVGSRLPTERALAGHLGVSRATVREAVRELWLKGLVERRPGAGTRVTSEDVSRVAFAAHLRSQLCDAELTLVRLMDLRAAIEPPIAARAAERATPEDVRTLEAVLAAMAEAEDAATVAFLDIRFHRGIAEATQNPLLVELIDFESTATRPTREEVLQTPARRSASIRGHRTILRALERHDSDAAAAAMAHHVRQVAERIGAAGRRVPDGAADPADGRSEHARGGGGIETDT